MRARDIGEGVSLQERVRVRVRACAREGVKGVEGVNVTMRMRTGMCVCGKGACMRGECMWVWVRECVCERERACMVRVQCDQ